MRSRTLTVKQKLPCTGSMPYWKFLVKEWLFIKSIGNFVPVKRFLTRLYKLISYNRKVIVARKCGTGRFDCSPVFNVFYRVLFMMICLLFNSVMLWPLHISLFSYCSIYHLT